MNWTVWLILAVYTTNIFNQNIIAEWTRSLKVRHKPSGGGGGGAGGTMKSTYRYRPQFATCLQTASVGSCKYIYKYLLLLTNSLYENVFKECSNSQTVRHIAELSRELRNVSARLKDSITGFVMVHIGGERYDTYLYAAIVDVMIATLGNVSIYTEDWPRFNDVLRHCNRISHRCTNLRNLLMVNAQIEQQQRLLNTLSSSSSSLTDIYDPKWIPLSDITDLPITGDYPKFLSFSEKQMRSLAISLCGRNKRFNFYYEFCPDYLYPIFSEFSKDSDHVPKNPFQETSLSLQDILPLNPKFYDKNRPPKIDGQATVVYFHVTVLSLDSINEESMTYVADIFLAQSWRDQRLRLPENMWEEYRILNVDWLHDIWKPDCFFKNAKQVTFHEISVPNHYLWLYHDKTLLYMSKLSLVLSCAMKFESYPHDTQACSMLIESLSHTTNDLVFKWNDTDPLVLNTEIELPQLDIVHNYTSDCTIRYSTGNFTCLAVVFTLRRRLGYHLFHTYIPSALIVVMSWISFWIKPEAIPARVTLGVTSLLTLATQNTQSQQSLPPVSYVKAIDIWMSSCSVFVFLSLMEFAVVNNYMGPIATKAMKGYSDEDVMISEDGKPFGGSRNLSPTRSIAATNIPQYVTFCNGRAVAVYIDKFSRIFFPFSFLLLNLVYWTSFL